MESGAAFKVGQMSYETVVIPPAITLRGTTLDRLEAFADAGGDLIFAGRIPVCCDAALRATPLPRNRSGGNGRPAGRRDR